MALVRKTETIKKELGSLAQVIDARLADTLRTGIRRDQLDALEHEIETADLDPDRRQVVEEELEATRERQKALTEQIDRLRDLLAESQKSIGMDKEHFRSAISCALELIGAEPLKPAKDVDGRGERAAAIGLPRPRPARGGRSHLGRHDGHAPRAPSPRPEALGMAPSFANPAGRLR